MPVPRNAQSDMTEAMTETLPCKVEEKSTPNILKHKCTE